MPAHDIVVIGASAGGIEPLRQLIAALPAELPASLFVVVHFPAKGRSVLPQILNRVRTLPAAHPRDGEPIEPGRIYVAPPDRHMLLQDGTVQLAMQAKENGHRPAVDPLFRSAARAKGPRVIGVILSGSLDDGTSGMLAVKAAGGITIAQDPEEAIYADMPRNAIENAGVDYVLPVVEIAELVVRLADEPVSEVLMQQYDANTREQEQVKQDIRAQENGERGEGSTIMTCPECGGVLWEFAEGELIRYRCHVGHSYSAASMLDQQNDTLEAALWTAVRGLEEGAMLARRLATRARARGRVLAASRFQDQAHDAERRADIVRQALPLNKVGNELSEEVSESGGM